jgi:hypothetical protein
VAAFVKKLTVFELIGPDKRVKKVGKIGTSSSMKKSKSSKECPKIIFSPM